MKEEGKEDEDKNRVICIQLEDEEDEEGKKTRVRRFQPGVRRSVVSKCWSVVWSVGQHSNTSTGEEDVWLSFLEAFLGEHTGTRANERHRASPDRPLGWHTPQNGRHGGERHYNYT